MAFPRCFLGKSKQDIEIAAFLASTIAWGNRKQIMNGCRKMLFDIMDGKPYNFVMHGSWQHIDPKCNIHRTFFGRDLAYMCRGLQFVYLTSNTLAIAFGQGDLTVWDGFQDCVNCSHKRMAVNTQSIYLTRHPTGTRAVHLAKD